MLCHDHSENTWKYYTDWTLYEILIVFIYGILKEIVKKELMKASLTKFRNKNDKVISNLKETEAILKIKISENLKFLVRFLW